MKIRATGGGIAQMARWVAKDRKVSGSNPAWCTEIAIQYIWDVYPFIGG